MPESKGPPADLPKAKGTLHELLARGRTATVQPYLTNRSSVSRGNSAIWLHSATGTYLTASFIACVRRSYRRHKRCSARARAPVHKRVLCDHPDLRFEDGSSTLLG
jgi:hypothetical protein